MLKQQRLAWRRGEPTPVETYLAQYPSVQSQTQAVLNLIYNEIVLREETGKLQGSPTAAQSHRGTQDDLGWESLVARS
jgi:hypothetical protein